MRSLKQDEVNLLERLLGRDVPGGALLRSQLAGASVYPINSDDTILRFQVSSQAIPAKVPYTQDIAVEASAPDVDGCRIEVLLHVKNGFLYELEYVKVDGSPIVKTPLDSDLTDFIVRV